MSIGYDKSEFQAIGMGPFGDFEIDRACNGRRDDLRVDGHVQAARLHGIPVSLYAYCEPGGRDPEFTADLLLDVARRTGIGRAVTLWADIEEGAGDLRWYEDRFLSRIEAGGWPAGTYSGDYFWGAHNLDGRPGRRWKAAYGLNDGRFHSSPRDPWDIWQGTSIPLDTNTADPTVVTRLFSGADSVPVIKRKFLEEEPMMIGSA